MQAECNAHLMMLASKVYRCIAAARKHPSYSYVIPNEQQ